MSVENAKALIAKAKEDKALGNKFRAAGWGGFEKVAADAGLACSVDEVRKAMVASGELTEEQLGGIAGGMSDAEYAALCCDGPGSSGCNW